MKIKDRMIRGAPILHALADAGLFFDDFKELVGTGESNYAGSGIFEAAGITFGTKSEPKRIDVVGAHAGIRTHLIQDKAMASAKDVLSGLAMTVSHGNVASTNGALEGFSIFVRNPGTGTIQGGLTGGLIMVYCASGSQARYKKGLLVDVLDMATTHPVAGGGTQGICIQLNPTSIVNNQVDAILINQNSAKFIHSGIIFNGKMGVERIVGPDEQSEGAVLDFIGGRDLGDDEGNKPRLFKFRSGGDNYYVTPAQFLTALGGNCTQF